MSNGDGQSPVEQISSPPTSSTPINSEIKIFYYIDDQEPPYLTKLNLTDLPRLKDFKNALDRNCTKYKFFFATNDPSIGKVKEEITNDEQILPFDTPDRILAYLVSIEGSTTSSGGGGHKSSKHHYLQHERDDTIVTSTTSSSFNIQQPRLQRTSRRFGSAHSTDYQKYIKQQRAVNDDATSFPNSDIESTTFLDETEDDRCVRFFVKLEWYFICMRLLLGVQPLQIQQQCHRDTMVIIGPADESIDYHPPLIE